MAAPLAVEWLRDDVPQQRAGALARAHVAFANAGTQPWRVGRFVLSYHWLDELGNPIVWDGLRSQLPRDVPPGEAVDADVEIRAPMPPGRYRLAIDLVDEGLVWLGELGSAPLELDVDVLPRIDSLDEAESRLGPAVAAHDRDERVLAAHREGYAVVGGSIEARRLPGELRPYAPGVGRAPGFPHPLVCPSVVRGVDVEWTEVGGLPAAIPPADEPSLYDGRITVRLPSGRRRG